MRWFVITLAAAILLAGCGKPEQKTEARPPVDVTVMTIAPRDAPVSFEYVGQTQSSRQVQIVARVNGFLDKRVYTEGSVVKAGEVMFLQDPKPFQAQLDAAQGRAGGAAGAAADRQRQPRAGEAAGRAQRTAQKDLDDATGAAAGGSRPPSRRRGRTSKQAQLNLGYTTITSPVTGLSSFARVQDGAYVSAENSLLTYVEQVDPIYVNFTLSENDLLTSAPSSDGPAAAAAQGRLRGRGRARRRQRVSRARAASRSPTPTSTSRPAPSCCAPRCRTPGALRPGQFVRVRVTGAVRANAILGAAAGRAAGREGTLRRGRRQGRQGRDPRRRGRAVVRRRLVHHRGLAGRRAWWWRTAWCACRPGAPVKVVDARPGGRPAAAKAAAPAPAAQK